MPFHGALARNETQTSSSGNWTQFVWAIFDDDKRYATSAFCCNVTVDWIGWCTVLQFSPYSPNKSARQDPFSERKATTLERHYNNLLSILIRKRRFYSFLLSYFISLYFILFYFIHFFKAFMCCWEKTIETGNLVPVPELRQLRQTWKGSHGWNSKRGSWSAVELLCHSFGSTVVEEN